MSEAEAVFLIIAITAGVKEHYPKLEGWRVLVLAGALALAFGFALEESVRSSVLRALRFFAESVGGVAAARYGAKTLGGAIGSSSPAPVAAAVAVSPDAVAADVAPVVVSRDGRDEDAIPTPREGSKP